MPPPPAPPPEAGFERTVVAGRPRRVFDLAEILERRDLLFFLVRRQVLARYKQTFLGVLWAVLQPFVTMVVFSIVLGQMVGIDSEGIAYPVFVYLGILPWQLFADSVSRGTTSLVGSAHLITQVYFPRVLIPASATLSALVDVGISFLVLLGLVAFYGVPVAPTIVLLVPLLVSIAAVATGIGLGLAALNVEYRDVGHTLPFLLQVWMFLTPVVYPLGLVGEGARWLWALNPMTGLVDATRAAVLGRPLEWKLFLLSLGAGLLLAALGAGLFRRMERRFADVV